MKKRGAPVVPVLPEYEPKFDYKFFGEKRTWAEARATCNAEYSGELASIHDYAEQHYVSEIVGDSDETWMGANALNVKGEWNWSDATAQNGIKWNFWEAGQP